MAIKEQLTSPTPLFAVVGAGDIVVAKVRASIPSADEVDGFVGEVKGLPEQLKTVPEQLKTLPDQLKVLPEKAQAAALDALKGLESTYAELAVRGESLVGRIRAQRATTDLEDSAKATAAKVKAASTTAKKSAKATKSAAKGAATSARKTAAAAKKAATAAADKVGD
ncbi:hypothetical protein FE697_002080 [Mumia zhuanghuii]|uniref:Heparin-binding hemagglutinin n=2 Tax=Mumia TaxID=1546255 RepID=A0ABW1QGK6_9ACTN|nr:MULTISPECIES: hypothetical protein [Mumia]KAA1424730.1 hypothetical protein FE697_002080 [Mumia zhuanghuii]